MRFGNGAWRMLQDVTPTYLGRVDGLRISEHELVLHVASRLEEERWATLEGHMFTVSITSPADDVLRVKVTHHKGRVKRGPYFDVRANPQRIGVDDRGHELVVVVGKLKLSIDKKPFGLRFSDADTGELITSSPFKSLGLMDKRGHGLFMREQLTLGVGEVVYGLGERFSAFCKNGQTVDMWNQDCGTCSDKGYKDVPFYLTSRGYGVYVNDSGPVSFEIGTEQVMRTQFGVPGEDLDFFLVYGPTLKAVLHRLGSLTGRPALPPVWSFGLWLTTSFTTDYDEATVMSFVDGMRERKLPLHVFHFDCFWMKAHHWCNFRWDEEVFPDPPGMLRRLREKGLKICVWINPYIGERSHLFDEGADHGYLLRRPNGDVFQRPKWQAGMGYVDFTNPEATRWYQNQLRALVQMGVDCFKTDFGEEIPTDVVYHDGADPVRMHQYYTYLYNKAVFEVLEEERGPGEACLFARSATATSQRFPVHWGGDCYGNYESMAESLRGGLSLALCGFGYWSHDIGGFESKASAAVYKRWVAFGLLSSHSRLHGSTSYRVPWNYDEEAVDVLRHFTRLKCRLMPYLMNVAVTAHETNVPMMRAMVLEFSEDPTCRTLDRQYMLGRDLLVAPVFHDEKAEFYLPEGEWTQLLTGEVKGGNRWYSDRLDFFSVPAWLRPNGVLAVGTEDTLVEYDFPKNVRLLCGKLDVSMARTVDLVDQQGRPITVFEMTREGSRVAVRNTTRRQDFQVQLPWTADIDQVQGGYRLDFTEDERRAPITSSGVLIQATADTVTVVLKS